MLVRLREGNMPAPGDYEIKGYFESLVDRLEEKNANRLYKDKKDKPNASKINPLDLLFGKGDALTINQNPGPGQYNIPGVFDKVKHKKKNDIKMGIFNVINNI
jgi:hypothetical protein